MKTTWLVLFGVVSLLSPSCTPLSPKVANTKGFVKPINNRDVFSFDEESVSGDTFRQAVVSGRLVPARCCGEIILTSPNHTNAVGLQQKMPEFGNLTVFEALASNHLMLQLLGRHTVNDRTIIVFVH